MLLNKRYLTLLFLFIPGILFSLEFHYSSSQLRTIINAASVDLTTIPYNSVWYQGYSLLETLPLMEEVYKIEINTKNKNYVVKEDDLAEYWGESFFLQTEASINLLFQDKLYKDITGISVHGTPMESTSLEIWLSWEGISELKEEISHFAEKYNLSIHTTEVSKPDSKLIAVLRARGDIPDLVMLKSSAVEGLVQSRAIQNLNYIKLPFIISAGKDSFTLKEKLWGVPFYMDTQVIFFNRNLIPNPPKDEWTLEDMEDIAKLLLQQNIHPLVWNAYGSNWLIPFQKAFGKKNLLNRDGSITVFDSPTEKALNYIVKLKEQELLVPMERDAMDALFIAGKVGMIISGSYAIPYFESLGINFDVLPFPINQETGTPLSPLLDFKGFSITRQTRAPILARRLLQHLSGAGVQQRFCPKLAKLPVRMDVLNIPGVSYGYLDVIKKTVETGTVIPPEHVYSIYKNNMWKLLRFALSGRMSVKETLQKGQILMENTTLNQR